MSNGPPDLTPVRYEQLDAEGVVVATGMTARSIYEQMVAAGTVTLREIPGPLPATSDL